MSAIIKLLAVVSFIMIPISIFSPRLGTFGKRPNWDRKKIVPLYFVAFLVLAGAAGAMSPTKPVDSQKHDQFVEQQNEKDAKREQAKKQKNDIFCKNYGLSLDQAQAIESALDAVGLGTVSDTTKDGDHINLNVAAKDSQYNPGDGSVKVYLDENNNLKSISIGNVALYNENGAVHNIGDVIVSVNDQAAASLNAEDLVKTVLKAPSTADFNESTFRYVKMKDSITVSGTVDAQNSFGAKVRTPFIVVLDRNNSLAPTHFVFNDEDVF